MRIKSIFIGRSGIRVGWRLALFLLMVQLLGQSLQWIVKQGLHYSESEGWNPVDFIFIGSLFFFSALVAASIMARIEGRSFRDYGLPLRGAFGSLFWIGMLWGLGTSAAEVGLIYLAGGVSLHGVALHGFAFASSALLWLGAMVLLGLWEEFLFRGYTLATLAPAIGFWPSAILFSLLFGAIHLTKPDENWIDITSIILYGLLWAFTLRRTGNIWLAIGFHAMSDYSDMVIFAAPNTGNEGQSLPGHLLNVSYHGPEWLTGGPRGIEASIMVFVILLLSFLLFDRLYPAVRPAGGPPRIATGTAG